MSGLRLRSIALAILSSSACAEPPAGDATTSTTADALPRDVVPPRAASPTPSSWAHYPEVTTELLDAHAGNARADLVLHALADALAPYRWAAVEDWDNTGFVHTGPDEPRGFVVRDGDARVAVGDGEIQLGCAGGFLEGVRAILVPEITMDDLRRCDGSTLAALDEHAPSACAPENFGLHAIVATAQAAEAAGATVGSPVHEHMVVREISDLDPLLRPGPVNVCTVSHTSAAHDRTRFHHHMMIVLRKPGRRAVLQVFDTTGLGGMQLREMTPRTLRAYVASALASHRTQRYAAASTELDCFAITRQR